jgi:hypothetical protein
MHQQYLQPHPPQLTPISVEDPGYTQDLVLLEACALSE